MKDEPKGYREVVENSEILDDYFRFYNSEGLRQSLGYRTPQEVYLGKTINKQEEIIHLKKSLFFCLDIEVHLNSQVQYY